MNYIEKMKLLHGAERAEAWSLFLQLAPCLIRPEAVVEYKRLSRRANELLTAAGIEPAFEPELPDAEFMDRLTRHFRQIKQNKREMD